MINSISLLMNNYNNLLFNQYYSKFFGLTNSKSILQELVTLGFEYYMLFPCTFSLESTKNFFLLDSLIKTRIIVKKTFLQSFTNNNNNSMVSSIECCNIFTSLLDTYTTLFPIYTSLTYLSKQNIKITKDQINQLINYRGTLNTSKGTMLPYNLMNSFNHGLTIYEYILSSFGTRKGILDTSVKTSNSGYLTRKLVELLRSYIIKELLCYTKSQTHHNLYSSITGSSSINKYILKYKISIKNSDKDTYSFTTVINCLSARSICKSCFGLTQSLLDKYSQTIGVIVGGSIGEPGTQLTLKTFHSGGATKILQNLNINKHSIQVSTTNLLNLYKNYKLLLKQRYSTTYNKFNILYYYYTILSKKFIQYTNLYSYTNYTILYNYYKSTLLLSKFILSNTYNFSINIFTTPNIKYTKKLTYPIFSLSYFKPFNFKPNLNSLNYHTYLTYNLNLTIWETLLFYYNKGTNWSCYTLSNTIGILNKQSYYNLSTNISITSKLPSIISLTKYTKCNNNNIILYYYYQLYTNNYNSYIYYIY